MQIIETVIVVLESIYLFWTMFWMAKHEDDDTRGVNIPGLLMFVNPCVWILIRAIYFFIQH